MAPLPNSQKKCKVSSSNQKCLIRKLETRRIEQRRSTSPLIKKGKSLFEDGSVYNHNINFLTTENKATVPLSLHIGQNRQRSVAIRIHGSEIFADTLAVLFPSLTFYVFALWTFYIFAVRREILLKIKSRTSFFFKQEQTLALFLER